jgi:hypothetical protein
MDLPAASAPSLPAADEMEEFYLGCRVRAKGLVQSAHHNGKTAVVIELADPETGRFGVRLQDGIKVRIKLCNLELLTERESFQAEVSEECLEMQQFLGSHPFPSHDVCIRNLNKIGDPLYASLLSSEVYAISRSIYENFDPFKDGMPDHPKSASITAAGDRLYAVGGIPAMTAVYYVLHDRHQGFVTLKYLWDGIGSWRA